MNPVTFSDWIFLAVGFPLGAIGLVVILLALFKDRARGRERCPRCWYDLQGVPRIDTAGATCPECGRAKITPKQMRRTRRRWWRASLGVVVILLGAGLALTPTVRSKGWPSIVPMTVLAFFAPVDEGPNAVRFTGTTAPTVVTINNRQVTFGPNSFMFPPRTPAEQLEGEAWTRVSNGEAWQWQADVLVHRWLRTRRIVPEELFIAPARWPAGEPILVYFRPYSNSIHGGVIELSPGSDDRRQWDRNTRLATAPAQFPGSTWIEPRAWFTVGRMSVPLASFRLSCEAVTRETLLDRLDSAEINAQVESLLNLRFGLLGFAERPVIIAGDRGTGVEWRAVDFAIAFRIAVVLDEREVARGRGEVNWDYPVWKEWQEVTLAWEPGALERVLAAPGAARLVVTGDYDASVEAYMKWPFSKSLPAAWTGKFERPLRVEDLGEFK